MVEARLRWREMLPIVTRELNAASKRKWTYRVRLIVACLGAGVVILGGLMAGPSVQFGLWLFRITSAIMLIAAALAGLLLTADSISREKREGTLGLLFLTRLVGADVTLGKLTVGLLRGGSVAFAAAPFLAYSVCLGGVTGREFLQMTFALLFVLVYSLVLGIFVSSLLRREAFVIFVFCLGMFFPLALTPFGIWKATPLPWSLAVLNPFFPALRVGVGGFLFPPEFVRPALFYQTCAIAFMVVFSCFYVPWTVRSQGVSSRKRPAGRIRRAARRAVLEMNPVLWLGERKNHPLMLLFICAGLRVVLGFTGQVPYETDVAYMLLLAIVPKLFVLWHSSGIMAAERESGFLETLLTTPIPAGEVLQGKMRAMKRQIFPALLFALLVQWATATRWWSAEGTIPTQTTLLFVGMIMLLIDVHTVAWVGMWQGLVARDRRRAMIRAALWGFAAPWILPLLLFWIVQVIFDPTIRDPAVVIAPIVMGANICSIGIACLAMAQLHEKFRSTATETWSLKPQ